MLNLPLIITEKAILSKKINNHENTKAQKQNVVNNFVMNMENTYSCNT